MNLNRLVFKQSIQTKRFNRNILFLNDICFNETDAILMTVSICSGGAEKVFSFKERNYYDNKIIEVCE